MEDVDRSALDFFLALTVVSVLILALFGVKIASIKWHAQRSADAPVSMKHHVQDVKEYRHALVKSSKR